MEMLSLRDLIQRVLDPAGRAAEAHPRMREVLQHIDATPVRCRCCCRPRRRLADLARGTCYAGS
jgi:hypothetical protein